MTVCCGHIFATSALNFGTQRRRTHATICYNPKRQAAFFLRL